ncbi:hypothetical protein AYO22_10349 [Fonsecaea multimorphosa]|nr:hypothetical protein AYO22_10349 [Fonsecaea multimorphosa]
MAPAEASARLEAELSLLEAMYPGNITFDSRSRDVHYTPSEDFPKSALTLRLQSNTPKGVLPKMRRAIDALGVGEIGEGVEVLDQVINIFEEVISETSSNSTPNAGAESKGNQQNVVGDRKAGSPPKSRTVVIWLHHLLATSKRKLAVNPTTMTLPATATATSPGTSTPINAISGITKPGHPGIMVFSGPRDLVASHVRELKALNWQAFQVRYDSDDSHGGPDEWAFSHDQGKIVEVESMAEVVRGIVREEHRQLFLKAVGVK